MSNGAKTAIFLLIVSLVTAAITLTLYRRQSAGPRQPIAASRDPEEKQILERLKEITRVGQELKLIQTDFQKADEAFRLVEVHQRRLNEVESLMKADDVLTQRRRLLGHMKKITGVMEKLREKPAGKTAQLIDLVEGLRNRFGEARTDAVYYRHREKEHLQRWQ